MQAAYYWEENEGKDFIQTRRFLQTAINQEIAQYAYHLLGRWNYWPSPKSLNKTYFEKKGNYFSETKVTF